MAVNTGRTTFKHVNFRVDDSGSTLREIAVNSLSVVGVTYEELDLTAWMDAVKNALPSMPDAPIEVGGPFDSTALTGSHTVLSAICGLMVPLTLDVRFGMRQAYQEGEPQFGITATGTSGYLCTKYTVDPSTQMYSARFILFPGSALPAWGIASET